MFDHRIEFYFIALRHGRATNHNVEWMLNIKKDMVRTSRLVVLQAKWIPLNVELTTNVHKLFKVETSFEEKSLAWSIWFSLEQF